MLAAIGVESMDDLLVDIPHSLRVDALELRAGLSEFETMSHIASLAAPNRVFPGRLTFRGGGVYRRFIPAAVAAVTSKPEFYTAYTPYQPEASQGTLQAIFEFQTLIAELTALDVANASLYDGATAVAEAAMMAHVQTGRSELLVAGYVHPEYVEVLRAFSDGRALTVRKGTEPGPTTAAVIFQQPDFLGLLVDAKAMTQSAHAAGALAVACVDPISLAVLAPPGEYGADIAVGEGQQLGLSPSYGGPHVGFISCRKELVRRLPGRLIGTIGVSNLLIIQDGNATLVADRRDEVAAVITERSPHTDVFLGVIPRRRRGGGRDDLVRQASIVWADCDTAESAAAMRRFSC